MERGNGTAAERLPLLDKVSHVLRIPERCLWFKLSSQSEDDFQPVSAMPTLQSLTELQGDDVRRRQLFKAVAAVGVGVSTTDESLISKPSASSVAAATSSSDDDDVEAEIIRATTKTIRKLDNKHGGGNTKVRAAVNGFLESTVTPFLNDARGSTQGNNELFSAAAEFYQLAAWIKFDIGRNAEGAQHLDEALKLCDHANDDALAAEMMAAKSHHAAFHRNPQTAVDLALAARLSAKRTGLAALQAEAAVLEAHGLALRGDRTGSLAALVKAEKVFTPGSYRPSWLRYFDEAYLAAKFAHTLRDLGNPREAEQFARRSLEMSDGYERGRVFNTALLASILADQRKVDEACATGADAVRMAGSVRSVRTVSYLTDLSNRLAPFRSAPNVQHLYNLMSVAGIPTP